MLIHVNGETKEVPAGLSLEELLEHLALPRERIAIELNQEVVRKSEWSVIKVEDDSRLEIVHFVGGG